MFWIFAAAALSLGESTNSRPTSRELTLENVIQEVVANGRDGVLPDRIAASVKMPENAPYRGARVSEEQATDGMSHNFQVLVSKEPDSDALKPVELAINTMKRWPGNSEAYNFHISLDGKLEDASYIHGKRDEEGRSVKGSGQFVTKDVDSSDIKKRFRHELDFWLKKAYRRKEWRSAEISDGELKM